MLKNEADPVTPDEFVLRLIWTTHYKAAREVVLREQAFEPRSNETDGISVFRVACLAIPEDALAVMAPEKRDRYALALLPVSELLLLGLTVQPSPIKSVLGHAVLPELNIVSTKADRPHWRTIQKSLAIIASKYTLRSPLE